jgi:hypothetical protein
MLGVAARFADPSHRTLLLWLLCLDQCVRRRLSYRFEGSLQRLVRRVHRLLYSYEHIHRPNRCLA